MAEEPKAGQQGAAGADAALKGDGSSHDAGASGQDAGKHVSKESWDSLLAEKKKEQEERRKLQAKLDKIEADQKKAADDKLKADGELQKLLESREKELADQKARVNLSTLKLAAQQAGVLDMDYVEVLMRTAKFNEQGELEDQEAMFKELREKKPYLFKATDEPPTPGATRHAPSSRGGTIYTEAAIKAMTREEREKAWPEIMRQMDAGLIKP